MQPVYTIGHSTRTIDEFIDILKAHGIKRLVDIRTVPRSRTNPQYNKDVLPESLSGAGIRWEYVKDLGGLRKPETDSINRAWRNDSFRGYADYMQTEQFAKALEHLVELSQESPTAIMCAESVWWRCHRSLVADALAAKGYTVFHIMSEKKADRHKLREWAHVDKQGMVSYPG